MQPRGAIATALLLSWCSSGPAPARSSAVPDSTRLVLWAWERPEDLRFIDPQRVAVAFLAETLVIGGDTVAATPRRQPLRVPAGTYVVAVVRIETSRRHPPVLCREQVDSVEAFIRRVVERTGAVALQIDFDATHSERAFYGALLHGLRRDWPQGRPLLITALASWCLDDSWIRALPVDEAVPMLFRMGEEGQGVTRRLEARLPFSADVCRPSLGVSMDEPWVVRRGSIPWVFNPQPWSPAALKVAEARARGEVQ